MTEHHAKLTPIQALLKLIVVAALIIGFTLLCGAVQLAPVYAGFFFLYFWGAVKGVALNEWLATLVGALGGLGLAAFAVWAGGRFGETGAVVGLGVIALAIYCVLMGWLPLVMNQSMTLFLTVGTIPMVIAQANSLAMAEAVVLAAVYFGLAVLVVEWIKRRGR